MGVRFQSILPDALIKGKLRLRALHLAESLNSSILKDFQLVTETWETKPKFEKILKFSGNKIRFGITTGDEVFGFLDSGTPEHKIPLSPEKQVFWGPMEFTPKTNIRVIGSKAGVRSGYSYTRQRVIFNNPGISARHFTDEIYEKWEPRIVAKFHEEVRRIQREMEIVPK